MADQAPLPTPIEYIPQDAITRSNSSEGSQGNNSSSGQTLTEHEDTPAWNNKKEDTMADLMNTEGGEDLMRRLSRRATQYSTRSSHHAGNINPAEDGDFDLKAFLKDMLNRRGEAGLDSGASLGVAFEDLTVKGLGSGVALSDSFGDLLIGPFRTLYHKLSGKATKEPEKVILKGFTGHVKPGEMCIVLGRPGSGSTTLLKTLTNYHAGYKAIEGNLHFDGHAHETMADRYRGMCAYLPEDDEHFPQITVAQTLDFAAQTRAPAARARLPGESRQEFAILFRDVLGSILGLKHTYNTKVGNSVVRGVSGGERKRVSIAEALATRATIMAHDNSTRGLDSSTALEYGKALRIVTDVSEATTLLSIYQCGENLYQLFDKVAVIHTGRLIYFGPVKQAKDYFISMGYQPAPRQTTPDFLVSVTDVHARQLRDKVDPKSVPRTADEMASFFNESKMGKENYEALQAYNKSLNTDEKAAAIKQSARSEKAGRASAKSPWNISYLTQIRLSLRRRAQLERGDIVTFIIKTAASIFQGLIIASAFFLMPVNTSAFFSRGGILFFAILFNAFQAMAELTSMFAQRPIIQRQKRFAMIRPSADALAQLVVELPAKLITILVFDILLYYISGLQNELGSQFFVFYLFTVLGTLSMIAVFRAIGAWCKTESVATAFAGILILVIAIYTGYTIPRPSMVVWFRWLSYASPVPFAFEAVITNEFRTINAQCASFVPSGPGYDGLPFANRQCTTAGFDPNTGLVDGDAYLEAQFGYRWSNTWRNLGFIMAYYVFFLAIFIIGVERQGDAAASGGVLIFKRGREPKAVKEALAGGKTVDEENLAGIDPHAIGGDEQQEDNEAANEVEPMHDVFTWKNVCYDVPIKSETRRLLDNVNGYVKPGKMTALMGESGAGKTTLLNVLAQRVKTGTISGDFLVNGQHLPTSFQRQTAYCQQEDIHLPTATVRESLIFSAMLRQPSSVSKAEKLEYVEEVIKMLEMESFAEAIVGDVGMGLNTEQRKRLTIGVELASKPQLLIFLDEPTSGLDSQSAWSIMRLLRRLSENGLSILCTIHQPSSELFQCFDRLLLLRRGGQIVYQGPLGENSKTMIKYFEARCDNKCADSDNPAEYMLDCIGAGAGQSSEIDWHGLWKESDEAKTLEKEIEKYHSDLSGKESSADQDHESEKQYAASRATQFTQVYLRMMRDYWRDPSYLSSRFAINVLAGLFIGFSFWRLSLSIADLQNKLFACFLSVVISTTLAQQLQPKYLQNRTLYEAREKPSRMYSWIIQPMASLCAELPWNMVSGTVYFFCFYFTVFYPQSLYGADRGAYWWFLYMIFQLYFISFGQAVAAISPDATAASVLFSSLFSFVLIFCGVFQPPSQLPEFWSSWMYPLSPFRYLISGLLSTVTGGGLPVVCADNEFISITPNTGTCEEYLGPYIAQFGGYLSNPTDAAACQFCNYENGDQFLSTLQVEYSNRWRNLGIFAAYCLFNIFLMLACTYLFREASFSFGKKGKSSKKPKGPPSNKESEEEKKAPVEAGQAEKGATAVPAGGFQATPTAPAPSHVNGANPASQA